MTKLGAAKGAATEDDSNSWLKVSQASEAWFMFN
jgi:hypothetical protein